MKNKIFAAMLAAALFWIYIPEAGASVMNYYWVEAESGTADQNYSTEAVAAASGGNLLTLYTAAASSDGSHDVNLSFSVGTSGKYDVWVLSTPGDSGMFSKFKWSMNGSTAQAYSSTGETNSKVYTHTLAYVARDVQWSRLAKEKTLPSGDNTFQFMVDTKSTSGTKSYFAMFDCLVVVPSSYAWQPDGSLAKPAEPPEPVESYAWAEAEGGVYTNFILTTNPNASCVDYLIGHQNLPADPRVDISFQVTAKESYDVWVLIATGCNSPMEYSVNGGAVTSMKIPASPDYVYKQVVFGEEKHVAWVKMSDEIYLENENNTVTFTEKEQTPGMYQGALDCIVVLPSSWNIAPGTQSTSSLQAYLDNIAVTKKYFSMNTSSVTENMTFPPHDTVLPSGSSFTVTSDKPEVIDNNGNVTRPLFTGNDTEVGLQVKTVKNTEEYSQVIAVHVSRLSKYNVEEFNIKDSGGTVIENGFSAGEAVTAAARVYLNIKEGDPVTGSAVVAMMLYDADGTLCDIVMKQAAVGITQSLIEANMTMPAGVSGCTLKAILINNWQSAEFLADSISATNR